MHRKFDGATGLGLIRNEIGSFQTFVGRDVAQKPYQNIGVSDAVSLPVRAHFGGRTYRGLKTTVRYDTKGFTNLLRPVLVEETC